METAIKRVLFIVTQSEMGGAQRFFHTLIPALDKNKFEVAVAAGPKDEVKSLKFKVKNYPLLEILEKENIKTYRLKHLTREASPLKDILAVFELKKLIKSWRPDTLFLNSSKAGFLGSFVSKFLIRNPKPATNNQKLITIYRIGGWTFNDPWPKWKKMLWILLEKMSAGWKDVIIVNNLHDLKQAKNLGIKPKEKIVLVHNGIEADKINFLPQLEARLKLFEKISRYSGKIFQAKNIIGTIANFYPAKDLENLIDTAKDFREDKETIFVIIGDGPEEESLKFKVKSLKLQNRVFLVGSLPEARQYLKAFDIFVLPSKKEGFPWSLLEAMAAKVPVIATKVGSVPEIIEDGKNGFIVEPSHPNQIANRIREILKNDWLKQELGIQAHQTILFKFTLEKMVKEVEALL